MEDNNRDYREIKEITLPNDAKNIKVITLFDKVTKSTDTYIYYYSEQNEHKNCVQVVCGEYEELNISKNIVTLKEK